MFKNPLRKYQAGGTAPTQEQQELLAAFVEWLPQRIEEFANMQPEQIVKALNGMSKTEEGQKQVQGWMEQFKKEMQSAQPAQFKEGGKIHQFLCKHAKGGHVADCGCNQQGGTIDRSKFVVPSSKQEVFNSGYLQSDTPVHAAALAAMKTVRVPWPGVGRRRMGAAVDNLGGKHLYERGDINGNTAQTAVEIPAPGDTIVRQSVFSGSRGWIPRQYEPGTDEYESVMKRFRPFVEYGIPYKKQEGGTLSDQYGTIDNDSRTPVRRWIDNVVGNSSTLSSVARGLNNFKQSAPGKVMRVMLPNPETGIAGAVMPVAKIAKAAKVRIPTQNPEHLAQFIDHVKEPIKPSKLDFDIDKLYNLNFDKFDAKSLIQNPPTMMQRFTGWVKGQLPKTTADWNKVGAGFTGGAIAGSLGLAGLVKAGQSKQNKSNK